MLPLPPFGLHLPTTLEEAFALLEREPPDAVLLAGGTDLVPNMKLGLTAPRHLVSLARVPGLTGIAVTDDGVRIGAMTTLDVVAAHPAVVEHAAAIAEAAAAVGGPHHRRAGTIGGNLCLDTRCRYYDQSYFWRSALGFCLKKDGTACHVVAGGRRCVAAASNDTAAAAIALGARVVVASSRGGRAVPAADFWTADGVHNTVLEAGEIVTALEVPRAAGRASAYEKLRRRNAIDFPLLSVAVRVDVVGGGVADLAVVVSALAARPRVIVGVAELAAGARPGELDVAAIAARARAQSTPLPNLDADVAWRKDMTAVLVGRALRRATLAAG